jgi:ribosomal protein S18 acetylase RimI-like enzyme
MLYGDDMKIEIVTQFSHTLLTEINSLIPQLSQSAVAISEVEFREIIESDTTHLLLALEQDRFCGMLTLAIFRIPTGIRAWIEDVVVYEADRGKGVAQSLLEAGIELASSKGAKTLDLTSRPARVSANRLYQKVGFKHRDTNVYRIAL